MSIQEEIFKEFFEKLVEDETMPQEIIEELKKLYTKRKIAPHDEIFNVIKEGCINVNQNKKD